MSILQRLFDSARVCHKFAFDDSSNIDPCHFSAERLDGLRPRICIVQAAPNTRFKHLLDEHGNLSVAFRLLLQVVGDKCPVGEDVGFVVAVPAAGRIEGFFDSLVDRMAGRQHY